MWNTWNHSNSVHWTIQWSTKFYQYEFPNYIHSLLIIQNPNHWPIQWSCSKITKYLMQEKYWNDSGYNTESRHHNEIVETEKQNFGLRENRDCETRRTQRKQKRFIKKKHKTKNTNVTDDKEKWSWKKQ